MVDLGSGCSLRYGGPPPDFSRARALCHRELAALHEGAGDEPRTRAHRLAAATLYRDLGMDQPVAS